VVCLSVCWLQPRAALKWLNQTICRVVVDLTAESEINVPPPQKKLTVTDCQQKFQNRNTLRRIGSGGVMFLTSLSVCVYMGVSVEAFPNRLADKFSTLQ